MEIELREFLSLAVGVRHGPMGYGFELGYGLYVVRLFTLREIRVLHNPLALRLSEILDKTPEKKRLVCVRLNYYLVAG